jgi:hypothetical protein
MSNANVVKLHGRPKLDVLVDVVVVYNSKRVVNTQVFYERKDALIYAEGMRQVGYRTKTLRRRIHG